MTFEDVVQKIPCESWIHSWRSVWPYCEPPKSYIVFGGLAAIGACLGRKCWFTNGIHITYPMLNLLLIGPSGVGKTTALESPMALGLVKSLPKEKQPQVIPGKITPQKLLWDLQDQSHAILYAEELAVLFTKEKYMVSLIPLVTKLLNYPESAEERTKQDDIIYVSRPSVIVWGGSTTEWLQDQLPDTAMTGGFLARYLIVHEQHRDKRAPLAAKKTMTEVSYQKLLQRRAQVFYDFGALLNIDGEIDFLNFEASDVYVNWYNNLKPSTGHLAPFAARGGEFVMRLAMLMAISCKRNRITSVDVTAAIAMWEYCEARLQEVVVPLSPKGRILQKILQAVGQEELSENAVCRAMRNLESASEVRKLVGSLLETKDLIKLPNGNLKKGKQHANTSK